MFQEHAQQDLNHNAPILSSNSFSARSINIQHGFEPLRSEYVQSLDGHATLYRHVQTGALLFSIENKDNNKTFGIALRTPPENSSGMQHILEHCVLEGSAAFPSKATFVEAQKGSLNTYMNASTYSDRTTYPVASQNQKDFFNLTNVYLDAVFNPLLLKETFQQEGWHHKLSGELESLDYGGIVFNEMKKAYSSPERRLSLLVRQHLFPDTPYRFDSGGDPAQIPLLASHAGIKAIASKSYHPSGAILFFYGNSPTDENLALADSYLQKFSMQRCAREIPLQGRIQGPTYTSGLYPAGDRIDLTRGDMVTVNWLLPEAHDPVRNMGLMLLSSILIGDHGAPLCKALMESGLGDSLYGGLDSSRREWAFSAGLKNAEHGATSKIEKIIVDTLASLEKQGLNPELISGAMNSFEYSLRGDSTDVDKGVSLFGEVAAAWCHGRDIFDEMRPEEALQAIKDKISRKEPYFEDLIKTYLLDNRSRVTATLEPDPTLAAKERNAEFEHLAAVETELGVVGKQAITSNCARLIERQTTPDSPEVLASIPRVGREDLEPKIRRIPHEASLIGATPAYHHDLFTNGLVHCTLAIELGELPEELLPYAPLLGRLLFTMGTTEEDYGAFAGRIKRTTGGVGSTYLVAPARETNEVVTKLLIQGTATVNDMDSLLSVMKEALYSVKLDDQQRFLDLIGQQRTRIEQSMVSSGQTAVSRLLHAQFSRSGHLQELLGGMSNLEFIRALEKQAVTDWPAVLEKLEAVRHTLLNRDLFLWNVTCEGKDWSATKEHLGKFLDNFPSIQDSGGEQVDSARTIDRPVFTEPTTPLCAGFTIPSNVNFVGKAVSLREVGYRASGAAHVATQILNSDWLWQQVRVQGQAYGVGCSYAPKTGVFTAISSADPNIKNTLDVFDRAGEFLKNLQLTDRELEMFIVSTIGEVDGPQTPADLGQLAMTQFLQGITEFTRQRRRTQILNTTLADIHKFGDALCALKDKGHTVVVGTREGMKNANQMLAVPLQIKPLI